MKAKGLTVEQVQARLKEFYERFGVTVRDANGFASVFPPPSAEVICRALTLGREKELWEAIQRREAQLRLWAESPLDHGYEPPVWAEADELLATPGLRALAVFGANRAGKSWWAAKRVCEAARAYSEGLILVCSETEESSVETAQKIIWHFLRRAQFSLGGRFMTIEEINAQNKRHVRTKINYTAANGFSDFKLVLPNGTTMLFATYKSDPGKYEGMELGARVIAPKWRPGGRLIENVGWWFDESAGLKWIEMALRRGRFRRSKGLWTFTPVNGLTPAMKEFLGAPKVLRSAPAELCPQAQVPGCPPGHMPRVAVPATPDARVIWFHVGDNPLGEYGQTVREAVQGKAVEYVERIAYGYARDSVMRRWPMFGPAHVVKPEQLPAEGMNVRVVDPHEKRPWFTIWVRVEGQPPRFWIYRDWPDRRTYGEWAVPTERETSEESRKGWDGDPGPAQRLFHLGYAGIKAEWRRRERIEAQRPERDPYRARRQQGLRPGEHTYEVVDLNLIDSRAGPSPSISEQGGTCIIWEMAKEHQDPVTGETLPGLQFLRAPGYDIDKGVKAVASLLEYDTGRPLDPVCNTPHLFVSEECEQVIWALTHWTGRAGEEGACKDPADCVRMLATSRLAAVDKEQWRQEDGSGW